VNLLADVRLAYSDVGSGLPVVLLHSYPANRHIFDGLADAVPARLIAADLPGFGETRLPNPTPDVLAVADLVGLVERWLHELGLGPVVLGGNAIGGYVMIELVARRPDLARGLILLGCKPAPDSPALAAAREATARLALEEGSATVAQAVASQPLAAGADDRVVAAHRVMIEAADPRGIAGLVRGLARRPDPVPSLRTIRVPTLVVIGSQDPFASPDQARELAALIPGARLAVIEGAGHLPSLERPRETAAAITAFVQELQQ
jgi:3-oxoadipate enol-lactonase